MPSKQPVVGSNPTGGVQTKPIAEDHFDISNASASRIVSSLCESSPHHKRCFGLVDKFKGPAEGRRYRVRLSPLGLQWIEGLERSLAL